MPNSFPETEAKKHLRFDHYAAIIKLSEQNSRNLIYFGLPSAELMDVKLWQTHLEHVFAIERESEIAEEMFRSAEKLKLRRRMTIVEMDLLDCSKLLTLDDRNVVYNLNIANKQEQITFARLRSSFFDVVYLDMYGGYLYKRSDKLNANTEILRNLFSHQKQFDRDFLLILTYNLRDTGAEEYDRFNTRFLSELSVSHKVDVEKLNEYYLKEEVSGHPLSMRRLRLALPMSILNVGRDSFEIASVKSWVYSFDSHLFSTRIHLKPRLEAGSLGETWPPFDEVRRILASPVYRLEYDSEGFIVEKLLEAPTLSI